MALFVNPGKIGEKNMSEETSHKWNPGVMM